MKNPQNTPSLVELMKMAKTDATKASSYILEFVNNKFPDLRAKSIRINESKVSLNSVNGFIETASGTEYFFKFHAEEDEEKTVKQGEYYNAQTLDDAGWPMIKPVYVSNEPGSQFLVYPKVQAVTAFDLFEREDEVFAKSGDYTANLPSLMQAEEQLLEVESMALIQSLKTVKGAEVADAGIFQLFTKRLASVNDSTPRVQLFYYGQDVNLPNGEVINFKELKKYKWAINGVEYSENLEELIESAKQILTPRPNEDTPVVLAHGDDHNGNKFYINGQFVFFDPAFAGWQPALLAFIKATFHNTFAHPFWLYDPDKLNSMLGLKYTIDYENRAVNIIHNFDFADKSTARKKILDLQIIKVWRPLITKLKELGLLPDNWKEYIKKALFCCPFLVYNLIDDKKYKPSQSLLALSKCIEMGSRSKNGNYVDEFLAQIS